ncbi:hypothetical protein COLO4_29755 [Corchorus olitorius]|uniref:Uncharacterized protein n=1 Tax=Corchorus olitorius TaxID=93759 RepID=A0A1R3HDC4_9ROSI|nr:hypothetical protein COLO4_29755 [Corchorus olitorius]
MSEASNSTFADLPLLDSAAGFLDEEEAEVNMSNLSQNMNKLIPRRSGGNGGRAKTENSKRKNGEGSPLPTTIGKTPKKGRRTFNNEGPRPTETPQRPKPKGKEESIEELISKKNPGDVVKILEDRANRRISNDKKEDMENCINKIFPHMKHQNWTRPDTDRIKAMTMVIRNVIKQMQSDGKSQDEIKAVVKTSLEMIQKAIHEADVERGRGVRASPCNLIGGTATNVQTADEGQESWQAPYYTGQKDTVKNLQELEEKVFANVKVVKFSHFQGLEEALLETAQGDIPKYLQDIAIIIQTTCGITETKNACQNKLILLYAAVYEMEHCKGFERLNWDRISLWGATYNQAKDAGFQVKFVEERLKKIVWAYHGYNLRMNGDPERRICELEDELEMRRKCLSAEKSFHDLFSP